MNTMALQMIPVMFWLLNCASTWLIVPWIVIQNVKTFMVMIPNHFHEVKYVEKKWKICNRKWIISSLQWEGAKKLVREIEREREQGIYWKTEKVFLKVNRKYDFLLCHFHYPHLALYFFGIIFKARRILVYEIKDFFKTSNKVWKNNWRRIPMMRGNGEVRIIIYSITRRRNDS